MGFFNKFSFDSMFRGNKKEEDQTQEPQQIEALPVFTETENMIAAKNDIQRYTKELKEYEDKIRDVKMRISNAKKLYQSECSHAVLTEVKQETSQSFNDYQFKCEHCGAEIFNHTRTVNYITTLIDLLGKASKMIESLTIVGIFVNSSSDLYNDINKLIKDLDTARSYALNIQSNNYNDHLKDRVQKKKTKEEKHQCL